MLFCGRDMHYGYVFTKEALKGDAGVEVRGRWGASRTRQAAVAAAAVEVSPNRPHKCACPPQVHQCDHGQLAHELRTADVAVPLMARLDAQVGALLLFAKQELPSQPAPCCST